MCNPVTVFNPERVLLKDTYLGYEYEVTCNGMAVRCGYIRVPVGHPWHGKRADDIGARAHGGVNFAKADVNCGKGGADDAWWFGFDCAHAFDARDPSLPGWEQWKDMERILQRHGDRWRKICSLGYVARECRQLIRQADVAAVKEAAKYGP
jgi:hypothetical protein